MLIVEDELLSAAHIKSIVEDMAFDSVNIATTAWDALEYIRSGKEIACATVDVRLADGLSGGVAGALMGRGIPFVICTGHEIVLRDFPRVPIVKKPFSAAEMQAAINATLSNGL